MLGLGFTLSQIAVNDDPPLSLGGGVPANVITTDDGDPITTDDGDYITTDS